MVDRDCLLSGHAVDAQVSIVETVLFDFAVEQLPVNAELARRGSSVASRLS